MQIISKPLNFKEAQLLADLKGIKCDLQMVINFCEKYKEVARAKESNFCMLEALSIAAVIKYSRIYAKGRRRRIPVVWLDDMPEKLKATHNECLRLRNKFFAHSVCNDETNTCVARLNKVGSKLEFKQVSVIHDRLVALGINDMEHLALLSKNLLEKIDTQIEKEKITVTKIYDTTKQ